jgi:hypothetical protein
MVARGLLLLAVAGCTIPEEDFPDEVAETYCERIWSCDPENAQDIYGSVGDCESFWSLSAGAWLDVANFLGEEYLPEEAPECIRSIRWASCDDIEDLDLGEECHQVLD